MGSPPNEATRSVWRQTRRAGAAWGARASSNNRLKLTAHGCGESAVERRSLSVCSTDAGSFVRIERVRNGRKRTRTRSVTSRGLRQRPLGLPRRRGQRVAFAWYHEEQWARLRELTADPDVLDVRYEDWLRSAESTVAQLEARGVFVRRLLVDVDVAAAWCARHRRPFNSAARAEYVAEMARREASSKAP
jgi:hypothetical protein